MSASNVSDYNHNALLMIIFTGRFKHVMFFQRSIIYYSLAKALICILPLMGGCPIGTYVLVRILLLYLIRLLTSFIRFLILVAYYDA